MYLGEVQMGRKELSRSLVKRSEGLSNRLSRIIRRYIYIYIYNEVCYLHGCFVYHILLISVCIAVYMVVCFVCFCFIYKLCILIVMFMYSYSYIFLLLLCIHIVMFMYCHYYVYVLLLLCLRIPIIMYALFGVFCFHRASWHSSANLTDDFSCFSSVVRQMPGYKLQTQGTASSVPT